MIVTPDTSALLKFSFPDLVSGLPQDGGDWHLSTDAGQTVLHWHPADAGLPVPDFAALAAAPEWLAHRKRELKTGLVGAMTTPYELAWATVPAVIRLHNPQLLSADNQSRHGADMADLAAALSAAQGAVDAAGTVAAAEAAAEAASIPTYRGPEA
jgi:hypothetical protein